MRTKVLTLFLALCCCVAGSADAADTALLDDVTVLALGALDGRAVVKTSDGKMHVLKVGDAIPGTSATLTQVHTDKLVVEETIAREGAEPARQTVWIHKPTKPGEKSTVQRMSSQAPAPQVIERQTSQLVDPTKRTEKTKN